MDQVIDQLVAPSLKLGVEITITLGLTLLALWLVKAGSRRGQAHVAEMKIEDGRKARLFTLVGVVRGTARIIILSLAFLILLATMGINITPLLTSLGIAGLALSLGAQTLIKDYLGGLFVLLENQYIVGEIVTLPTASRTANPVRSRKSQCAPPGCGI
jgi:small conductance mechanosensitive channel